MRSKKIKNFQLSLMLILHNINEVETHAMELSIDIIKGVIKQMNNIVELKGKIVCKYVTPNKNNVLLKIGCRGNAISCFTADDSLKRQLQSFEVGDYINITGNIQSSKRQDRITQVVFIDEIRPPKYTDISLYNQFWLNGTVVKMQELDNCMRIIIRTDNDGRISYVPVVYFHPDVRRLNFEIGQSIHTQGSIQSVRKADSKGGYVFYQNYVGSQDKTG